MTALEYYRKKTGLTQIQLASITAIDPRQIQRYESGYTDLGHAYYVRVLALASALGVTPDQLVTDGKTAMIDA